MNKNINTKSTKTMRAVSSDLTIAECCEKDCQMTMLVEKSEVAQGRKNRCTACVMKSKIRNAISK